METSIQVVRNALVRRVGRPSRGQLLCVHGFADSGQAFLPLAETTLPSDFELIIVDLPGFGASPPQPELHTVRDYGAFLAALVPSWSSGAPLGLVAHSIGSAVAVEAAKALAEPPLGVFSIEGNLTEEDAYFSGRAARHAEAGAFKETFVEQIWTESAEQPDLRRYIGGVIAADPAAMWALGRDAAQISAEDAVGYAYRTLPCPSLYYWNAATTSARTARFIEAHGIAHRSYAEPSHWPMVRAPEVTAEALRTAFNGWASV